MREKIAKKVKTLKDIYNFPYPKFIIILWVIPIIVSIFALKKSYGAFVNALFCYLITLSAALLLTSFFNILYLNIKIKKIKLLKLVISLIYTILFFICLFVIVPFYVIGKSVGTKLKIDEKSIEVLQYWAFIFMLDLIILALSLDKLSDLSLLIVYKFQGITGTKMHLNASAIFVLLTLSKIELDIFNNFVLWIVDKCGKKIIRKNISSKKSESDRNNDVEKMQNLKYMIKSIKYACWKFQLAFLIFIFINAAFFDTFMEDIQGDIVNVVTFYTLIMLYWDKRKEFDNSVKNEMEKEMEAK